jgi:hypothetical protein
MFAAFTAVALLSSSLTRKLVLCCAICVVASACAPVAAPKKETAKPVAKKPPRIVPLTVAPVQNRPAVQATYLQAIYKLLAPGWNHGVRDWARDWLPKKHPANNPHLAVVIDIEIDHQGKPQTMRLVRSSLVHTIDNSALRTIKLQKKKFPPLPASLSEQKVQLRWYFFRDERGCDVRFARLTAKPLAVARRVELALLRKQFDKARAILQNAGPVEGVRWALADAAFASKDPRLQMLALGIAPSWHLKGLLSEAKTTDEVWNSALDTLIQRKAAEVIAGVLEDLAGPRYEIIDNKTRKRLERYQLALLQALVRLGKAPAEKTLAVALRSPSRAVVAAAASLTRSTAALDAVLQATTRPTLRAQLAARRLRMSHSPFAANVVNEMLRGKLADRLTIIRALQNHPVQGYLGRLEGMVRDASQTKLVRIEAVRAIARIVNGRTKALYKALSIKDVAIQVAVISELPRLKNKVGASYRLAEIAYKNRRLAAAAVNALARIGHRRFGKDIMWLTSRLSAADQARVVPRLPVFKRHAFPFLKRLLRSKKPVLKVAALRALRKLGTKEALALVESMTPKSQEIKTEEPPARQTKLEALIRQALSLMKKTV